MAGRKSANIETGDEIVEWIRKLNEAVNYIEDNLDKDISIEKAAQIACCSSYHFQRMFSYIAEVTLAEYIRKRRMTLAAFDLQHTDEKIIDIALKYGYESPTAFNRAFQGVHHISPTAARQEGVSLVAYPKISFKLTVKGASEMKYRIENKSAFRIVGVKKNFPIMGEQGFSEVPLFWQETIQKGLIPQITSLNDSEPCAILGVSTGMDHFDYYIAVPSSKQVPEGMTAYEVPAATYAIFECYGMANLASLERAIMTEWLPTSGYAYAEGADVEVYPSGDQNAEDYYCEVWLPVKEV